MPRKPPPKETWWKPGQSGNPSGRPKGRTLTGLLREFVNSPTGQGKQTWGDRLVEAIARKASRGNVAAFSEIMDRLEGKPLTRVKLDAPDSLMPGVPDAELAKKLANRGKQGPDGGPAEADG